ncbi:hypothetical protein JRI60_40965 [Archangium violaceum]|uniref:hypothetical protein n=1 Tax=Archangium violaceum TaxID=83451 RepID=UPI00194EE58E|nr:hypothetical protein [Archangium violaceum]QRN95384.1 hypothetical protein JRI60_40965 [Archangium violaceum]
MKRQWTGMGLCGVLMLLGLSACGGVVVEPSTEAVEEIAQEHRRESTPPEQKWVRNILATTESETVAIRHDPRGNVVVLVTDIGGPIDFGAGPISPPASASGSRIAGLAKYAPDGSLLWGIILSGEPTAELPGAGAFGAAMTVDSKGNIVLSLSVGGRLVLDGVTMTMGEHLLKLDPDGHALWALRLPTRAREVAVDRKDRIAITGTLEGATEFDFGEGPITGADFHAFVAKYSSRGELEWVFVDDVVARTDALTADEHGNFYFGGIRFPELPSGVGTPYLRKVSCDGEGEWSRGLEGSTGAIFDLAARDNRVVAVGIFNGSFEFRGRTFTAPADFPSNGIALAFTGSGNERWARQTPGLLVSVDIDNRGGVLVAGSEVAQPDARLFIARFLLSNGRVDWSRGFNEFSAAVDSSANKKGEIAVTGDGPIYVIQFGR